MRKGFGWLVLLVLMLALGVAQAQPGKVTYVYTDPQGTPLAEADANGNITANFDYKPYGDRALDSPPAGPGYTGHVNDPDTGLVYMQARYYDPTVGRFLSVDAKGPRSGDLFHFNRYDYANNSPVTNMDPDGRDCTTSNQMTTCFTAVYRVTFPAQPGFKDFTSTSPNYHFYSVPVATPGRTVADNQNYLAKNPTPGFSHGASPQGTPNDATPVIGNMIPISISPVMSFQLTNQVDGKPVVVNVTEPGHQLQSGIVVREASQSSDGTTSIQSWGEGTASLQAPGSLFGKDIDNVWQHEGPPSPPNSTGCSAAAGPMNNVCNK